MSDRPPAALRYAPHAAVASTGYVTFAYAAVPAAVVRDLGVDYAALGLLTSAPLLSFVVVQPLASRLLGRHAAARVLLWATAAHAGLAVALAWPGGYPVALALRVLWGLAAGAVLSAGATLLARRHTGRAVTRQQGLYGGSLTLGGAVAFLVAPRLVPLVGSAGTQLLGAPLALPAVAALLAGGPTGGRSGPTAPAATASPGTPGARGPVAVLTDPTVLVAALCYVATVGSYVTLSTFVTAYFEDLGVGGPLNAGVLLTATAGRAAGATALRRRVGDRRLVAGAVVAAAAAFAWLADGPGRPLLLALPLGAMLAVSLPFGPIYALAAAATDAEGTALAAVVAAGNVAALGLPYVAGALRDATGSYGAGFALLGAINAVAAVGALALAWRPGGRGR